MSHGTNRRSFLQTTALGGALGLSGIQTLPRVSAADATLNESLVAFGPDVEPLVRLVEETPRERLLEEFAARIRAGASYRQVLAALMLAGIRNVQPRPAVGFKFHSVLVVNACYVASLSGPDEDRWLPIFWALDYFKTAQAEESRKTGWRMPAVRTGQIPVGPAAREAFITAMDRWDVEAADVATAGIVRTLPATEVFELFARYAARDFRSIGHKAIFLANAWRTLQVIGWDHAEPVLRSLTFALLNHEGEPDPATHDLGPDQPWRNNAALLEKVPAGWLQGTTSTAATREQIALTRTATADAAASAAVSQLAAGQSAAGIWDGNFLAAGELLMRQPGIISLHGLTTVNALHYLWRSVGDTALRQRLLLQACSFSSLFRQAAERRGELQSLTIDALQQPSSDKPPTTDEIFADISRDGLTAARKLLSLVTAGGDPLSVIDTARRYVFLKGRDAHDYKFSTAVLEDWSQISPEWRPQFLALSVFNLKGSGDADSPLVERTRAALKG